MQVQSTPRATAPAIMPENASATRSKSHCTRNNARKCECNPLLAPLHLQKRSKLQEQLLLGWFWRFKLFLRIEMCSKLLSGRYKYNIRISMTDKGDPYENAIAERVNGILKTEWLYQMKLTSLKAAREAVDDIVRVYNEQRPHLSVGMLTPMQARFQSGEMKKYWKNYWALKQGRQQPAGEEGPYPEPPAAGRVVAAAPGSRAAAVPQ